MNGYRELTVDQIVREHILATLEHTGWNKTRAAKILDVERSTLDRKLKRYGVSRPERQGSTMSDKPRVRLVGNHPWSGFTGIAIAISSPTPQTVLVDEKMVRIRLDRGQDCPAEHECYAFKGEFELIGEQ